MKNIIKFILIAKLLTSCNFFGPVESSIETHNVDYSEKDIIGTWKLDNFSYDYLSKKEKLDSIYIIFNKDSTFIMNNSIDLFKFSEDLTKNEKINGTIDNQKLKGTWSINKIENYTYFTLNYEKNKNVSGLNVYKKENQYQIWYFLGDPDMGQRLRFLKEN